MLPTSVRSPAPCGWKRVDLNALAVVDDASDENLIAIDDQPASKIIDFAQLTYGDDLWEKRFREDIVEVLTKMGKPPGDQVKLELREPGSDKTITMENVPMTKENRRATRARRRARRTTMGRNATGNRHDC